MSGNIDVTVENQLVRFVAPEPIDGDAVVQHLDGQRVGKMVIKALYEDHVQHLSSIQKDVLPSTERTESKQPVMLRKNFFFVLVRLILALKPNLDPSSPRFSSTHRSRFNPLLANWVLEKVTMMTDSIVESSRMTDTILFFMYGKTDVVS